MSGDGKRLWGIRGAVQAERNDSDSIIAATRELRGIEPR